MHKSLDLWFINLRLPIWMLEYNNFLVQFYLRLTVNIQQYHDLWGMSSSYEMNNVGFALAIEYVCKGRLRY